MLFEFPLVPAALGGFLGLLAYAVLMTASPYFSRHCRRIKPRADEDARPASPHLGFILAGSIVASISIYDFWHLSEDSILRNRLMTAPLLSLVVGFLLVSFGSCATFASPDSRSSLENKILSVIWLWLTAFTVWDRARPPLFTLAIVYTLTALSSVTMLVIPDVSSIISFATVFAFIVACCVLELGSNGYGPVATEQYALGFLATFLGAAGAFLQFLPHGEMSTRLARLTALAALVVGAAVHGYLQESVLVTVFSLAAVCIAWFFPQNHSQLGSWASVIAVLTWWSMLRLRPGNPPVQVFDGYELFAVPMLIFFKLSLRRLLAVQSMENVSLGIWMENFSILAERTVLCGWAYYLLFVCPVTAYNFFIDTVLCWTYPAMPSFSMNLYYLVNVASSLEDVIWWWTSGSSTPRYFSSMAPADYRNGRDRDAFDNKLIGVYHLLMAGFLVGTYYSDHVKIGTVVLFLHHVSDVVHYLWRLTQLVKLSPYLQGLTLGINTLVWFLCRGWWMLTVVMYSIAWESKSFRVDHDCMPGECSWLQTIERFPMLACLVNLTFLNVIWFVVLSLKGYEMYTGAGTKRSGPGAGLTIKTSTSLSSSNLATAASLSPGGRDSPTAGDVECGMSSCMSWNSSLNVLLLRHR